MAQVHTNYTHRKACGFPSLASIATCIVYLSNSLRASREKKKRYLSIVETGSTAMIYGANRADKRLPETSIHLRQDSSSKQKNIPAFSHSLLFVYTKTVNA